MNKHFHSDEDTPAWNGIWCEMGANVPAFLAAASETYSFLLPADRIAAAAMLAGFGLACNMFKHEREFMETHVEDFTRYTSNSADEARKTRNHIQRHIDGTSLTDQMSQHEKGAQWN